MHRLALQLWRHRFTLPAVLGAVGLLMALSLVQQHQQWQTMLTDSAPPTPASAAPDGKTIDLEQLGNLFGVVTPKVKEPPRNTNLPLTLLGSFVNTRTEHSAAVIQVSGKAPRRVVVGQEVVQGVRLEDVSADHVVLVRGGVSERLFFPQANEQRGNSASAGPSTAYSTFKAAQLSKLPALKADKRAQQKTEMLLQALKPQDEAGYIARP